MGDVLKFKSAVRRSKHSYRHARLEKELSLPLPSIAISSSAGAYRATPETPPTQNVSAIPEARLPLIGVAIIMCMILAYTVATFHLVDQPHYSARANLLPAVIVQY